MRPMTRIWLLLLCAMSLTASEPGVPVQFIGGTLDGLAADSSARLYLNGPEALVFRCCKAELNVAYQKINTLKYGQDLNRPSTAEILVSPVRLLSKSRTHFVTIGYTDAEGKQQALVIRVKKGDIRVVLAVLEARTGRRVEYEDDEARKAGKK